MYVFPTNYRHCNRTLQRLRSLWVSPSLGNPIYFAGVIDVCLNEALQGTKIPDNMLLHEQLNRGIVPGFRTELPIALARCIGQLVFTRKMISRM